MDYKQKLEVMNWHSLYSDMNGSDFKILTALVYGCTRHDLVSFSYDDLSKKFSISKLSVAKSIKKLIEQSAIIKTENNNGARAAEYKVRSFEDLVFLFSGEKPNDEIYEKWEASKNLRFEDIENKLNNLDDEIEACQDCENENGVCSKHQYQKRKLEETQEYREYKIWLKDNPRPNYKIKTMRDIVVVD